MDSHLFEVRSSNPLVDMSSAAPLLSAPPRSYTAVPASDSAASDEFTASSSVSSSSATAFGNGFAFSATSFGSNATHNTGGAQAFAAADPHVPIRTLPVTLFHIGAVIFDEIQLFINIFSDAVRFPLSQVQYVLNCLSTLSHSSSHASVNILE
jgi:hypothetical protein